jgi:hypothetical protein
VGFLRDTGLGRNAESWRDTGFWRDTGSWIDAEFRRDAGFDRLGREHEPVLSKEFVHAIALLVKIFLGLPGLPALL